MVNHLCGNPSIVGRPTETVRQLSNLRIVGISEGSVIAELELSTPTDAHENESEIGQHAISQILRWEGEDDDSLPQDVADELIAIGVNVSDDVDTVRLADPYYGRSVSIKRKPKPPRRPRASHRTIDAILFGSLKEVNWTGVPHNCIDSTTKNTCLCDSPTTSATTCNG